MATRTTRKPSAGTRAGAAGTSRSTKPAPATPPGVVDTAEPTDVAPAAADLKMKELVDRVTEATGGKRPMVRSVTEAVLAQLGTALAGRQTLSLPRFGKARVVREVDRVITIKLRRPADPKAAEKEPGAAGE